MVTGLLRFILAKDLLVQPEGMHKLTIVMFCVLVGKVPPTWKHAFVTLVYNTGLASAVEKYRPISLTSVACKIMKRVIVSETLSFIRSSNVITKHQH